MTSTAAAVRTVLIALVGLLLAGTLAACGDAGAEGPGGTAAAPAVSPSASPSVPTEVPASEQPIQQAQRTGSVAAERPVAVRLPSGRRVPVQAVSSHADGSLAVPDDIDDAGWFRGGSALGDPFGSTLLAAHVDSVTQGLGPFEELLSVRPGQRVTLTGATLSQTFRVDSLRLIPQGSLDDDQWIYSPAGRRRLTLVTCAPPYDRARGGYQNLAVVTALPLGDATIERG